MLAFVVSLKKICALFVCVTRRLTRRRVVVFAAVGAETTFGTFLVAYVEAQREAGMYEF
jgi:hypothetical protein